MTHHGLASGFALILGCAANVGLVSSQFSDESSTSVHFEQYPDGVRAICLAYSTLNLFDVDLSLPVCDVHGTLLLWVLLLVQSIQVSNKSDVVYCPAGPWFFSWSRHQIPVSTERTRIWLRGRASHHWRLLSFSGKVKLSTPFFARRRNKFWRSIVKEKICHRKLPKTEYKTHQYKELMNLWSWAYSKNAWTDLSNSDEQRWYIDFNCGRFACVTFPTQLLLSKVIDSSGLLLDFLSKTMPVWTYPVISSRSSDTMIILRVSWQR